MLKRVSNLSYIFLLLSSFVCAQSENRCAKSEKKEYQGGIHEMARHIVIPTIEILKKKVANLEQTSDILESDVVLLSLQADDSDEQRGQMQDELNQITSKLDILVSLVEFIVQN